jgi:hypothetical protein
MILAPYARSSPANEAVVASSVWSKVVWQITPWCPRSQDPEDAVQNTAVVHTRDTARFVRQHRLDGSPFVIVELVAHDSRLRFGSLNHELGDTINPIAADDNPLILLPLSGPQPTAEPTAGLGPNNRVPPYQLQSSASVGFCRAGEASGIPPPADCFPEFAVQRAQNAEYQPGALSARVPK